ncbi:BQ2448_4899 [Microbotryum intermedium]|uniref:BQ2448_4899 protein n=1 Tax=Microbotryum intermedium TaxID=269621 RepID=A0A238FG89_9BASI|nr:BQ2448_4899 [Microbotryum intermedium]
MLPLLRAGPVWLDMSLEYRAGSSSPSLSPSSAKPISHRRDSSIATSLSSRMQPVLPFSVDTTYEDFSASSDPKTPPRTTEPPPPPEPLSLISIATNPLQHRRAPTVQGPETPTFVINRKGKVVDKVAPFSGQSLTYKQPFSIPPSPSPSRTRGPSALRRASSAESSLQVLDDVSADDQKFFATPDRDPNQSRTPANLFGSGRRTEHLSTPERNGGAALSIPLLLDGEGSTSTFGTPRFGHHRNKPDSKWSKWLEGDFGPRVPLTLLLPAFLLGIFLSMMGTFGPNMISMGRGSWGETPPPQFSEHPSGLVFLHPSALDPSSVSSSLSPEQIPKRPRGQRHPIYDLIQNATSEWEAKLARQSTSLYGAVKEYKRRHGRNPPKGFDRWYQFARENNVKLIDEFDQTFTDILPFYALPPRVLHQRAMLLQDEAWTFTIQIKGGELDIIGAHARDGRAKDQAGLMKRWAKYVDKVNITMSAHDGPSMILDYTTKMKHLEAAQKAVYLSGWELAHVDDDAGLWGFELACSNNSRLRRMGEGLETTTLPLGPSYISNHLQAMDLCENPEWRYMHGFTAWPGLRPGILEPIFSFSKTTMHSDILLPPLEQYWDHEPWDPEWRKKLHNKVVWRGTTTGVWFDRTTWWRNSQRVRLWFKSKDTTGTHRVRFDGQGSATPRGVPSIVERDVPTKALVDRYLDFAFTGKEGQCTEEDGSCEAVRKLFDFQRGFGWNEANEYKYQLDLDGNAWSGRFHRLLSANQAILKSTIFPEWYSNWIQPWVHYIPVKVDYTDLFDIMAFFAGDLRGENAHDDLAQRIARQGQEFAQTHWRYADMEAYVFRLALEWARCSGESMMTGVESSLTVRLKCGVFSCVASDRASMDYFGPGT